MTRERAIDLLRNAVAELIEGAGVEYLQDLAGVLGMSDEEIDEIGLGDMFPADDEDEEDEV